MSLINEALKKAQKLRTGDPAAVAPVPGAGNTRITKRAEPRSTQQLVLIAASALALVVLTVVATFWFINRTPEPKPAPKPIAVKPADVSGPAPTIVAPALKPAVVAPPPLPDPAKPSSAPVVEQSPSATAPVTTPASTPPLTPSNTTKPAPQEKVAEAPASTSAPTAQTTPPVATTPAPTPATTPPPTQVAAAPVPPSRDPRVDAFVDTVKVKGILPSGTDSRVLMNDRVFRVNDIVERNLGVRLTKVESNALTFTDSNGAVYVKNF